MKNKFYIATAKAAKTFGVDVNLVRSNFRKQTGEITPELHSALNQAHSILRDYAD